MTGAEGCRQETDKEDAPAPAPPCSPPHTRQSASLLLPWALMAAPSLLPSTWGGSRPRPCTLLWLPAPSSLSGPLMVLLRVPCLFPQHPD